MLIYTRSRSRVSFLHCSGHLYTRQVRSRSPSRHTHIVISLSVVYLNYRPPMQSSTRPAPHIPAELLEKIFWHARHHHSTLASCARVCHFWLPTSRRLLYSRVRVGSFSQRSQNSQRSLLGGLPQLADILDSAPPIRDYIQRVEVAWTTSIDCQALASTLALLPKVLTLSFWNTGRLYDAPDRQFLAFSGIQHLRSRHKVEPIYRVEYVKDVEQWLDGVQSGGESRNFGV